MTLETQTTLAAIKEFVFGTKEKEAASLIPDVVLPAPTPTASLTPLDVLLPATPLPAEALLPTATPPQPFASAPESVPFNQRSLA